MLRISVSHYSVNLVKSLSGFQ